MAIPLPKPPEAGGYILEGAKSVNALTSARLKNKMQELQNKFYPEITQANIRDKDANIDYRNALTNKTNTLLPYEEERIRLYNALYPELTRARINSQNAITSFRSSGLSGLGAGARDQLFLNNLVSNENPQLKRNPEKVYQAVNALAEGRTILDDGTKLNPLTFSSRAALDRVYKNTTTAALINNNIKSQQAEAELSVLDEYAQKGLEPYGDTYLNISPDQIMDSFKSDEKSQKRLGKFIASQALQFEAAQNRVRLANGQPGVTTTEELMKISGQIVDAKYPKLSYTARKEAARFLDEALTKGLQARKSVGISPSSLLKSDNNQPKSESEKIQVMTPDGQVWNIPQEKVEEAIKRGAKRV